MTYETQQIKRLEILPRKSGFTLGYIFGTIMCIGLFLAAIGTLLGDETIVKKVILFTFLLWICGLLVFASFDAFRASRVKGPVFSFSKHGFIDHRSVPAQNYDWEELKTISWTSHSSKGIGYQLLRIDIMHPSISHKLAKFFLHHPFEINSRQIIFKSPTELEKALRKATPNGKFKPN